jgi:hypothetical protein
MPDLRYPIGPFEAGPPPDTSMRLVLLSQLAEALADCGLPLEVYPRANSTRRIGPLVGPYGRSSIIWQTHR